MFVLLNYRNKNFFGRRKHSLILYIIIKFLWVVIFLMDQPCKFKDYSNLWIQINNVIEHKVSPHILISYIEFLFF